VNVPAVDPAQVMTSAEVRAEVAAVTAQLGQRGRVVVRNSGTEALVRIMVEAVDEDLAQLAVDRLLAVVERVVSGSSAP
jgi:phosphoglucosamine mutase